MKKNLSPNGSAVSKAILPVRSRVGGLAISTEAVGACFRRSFRRLQLCNMTSKSKFK